MLTVMNTAPITELVNQLPERSITTMVLGALDFVVPGEWDNCTDVETMVRSATGIDRAGRVQAIANHLDQLYEGDQRGCQRAVWLYQCADSADRALGAAALANKVGDRVGFLSFLSKLTPKADTTQSLDLALKLSVEMLAYSFIHGLSREAIGEFVASLDDYGNEAAMRMAGIICLDGLIPLGPDFISIVHEKISGMDSRSAEKHPVFKRVADLLPGSTTTQRLGFVKDLLGKSSGWVNGLIDRKQLSQQGLLSRLGQVVELSDDKLDYVGAFLDATTNYMTHTGIQSAARHLAQKSAERFGHD